jgi:hypothetical protein
MKAFLSDRKTRVELSFYTDRQFLQHDAIEEAKRILAETEKGYDYHNPGCKGYQKESKSALAEALKNFIK